MRAVWVKVTSVSTTYYLRPNNVTDHIKIRTKCFIIPPYVFLFFLFKSLPVYTVLNPIRHVCCCSLPTISTATARGRKGYISNMHTTVLNVISKLTTLGTFFGLYMHTKRSRREECKIFMPLLLTKQKHICLFSLLHS